MSTIRSIHRVVLCVLALVSIALGCCAGGDVRPSPSSSANEALAALERASGGRLGVFVLDTGGGRSLAWRADERFGMCSTFKLLLAAAVLQAARNGELDGDAPIGFGEGDLVPHAPVIRQKLADGVTAMTAVELARATQITSDNVAANLLIRELGGPQALTGRWRAMGDGVTRIDRFEPDMNLVPEGEQRDTTTPRAMAQTVARLFTTDLLDESDRERLAGWLVETQTGRNRLRAGFPSHWRAGDKTGSAIAAMMANKTNDVAVIWPPGGAPVVVAAYYDADGHHPGAIREQDEAVLAEVGRIVAGWLAP